jgi:hypothetical protein
LHIVSFDVPYPANYGGVMDVFYKLKALKQKGVKIHLHCFTYGREASKELDVFCETVNYYKRKTGIWSNFSKWPYTVKSRQSKELKENLLKDQHPILFEVLHTTFLMADPAFKGRKLIYRHSNIEHDYYLGLSKSERNFLKKFYLRYEAFKLKQFESIIKRADLILAVNKNDTKYFEEKYPEVKTVYLPSFHPNDEVKHKTPEEYILFHGNLSVSENSEAALWLLKHVFAKIEHRVIIAGLNPPAVLRTMVSKYKHVQLKVSPLTFEMRDLIQGAKLHVLYTAQATGLKLKLLNVLYTGNFVLCNPQMLEGTDIEPNGTLKLASGESDFITQIETLMNKQVSEADVQNRKEVLHAFDNANNATRLFELVFSQPKT